MKTWLMLLVSACLAGAVAGQTSTPSGSTGKAGAAKAAPGTAKKEEPPPKIEGMEVSRGAKGFLGLQVVDGRFKMNFYDTKKKPMKPDVARAALRWDPKYKSTPERVLLSTVVENALTSDRVIRPPYNFKLYIMLLGENATGDNPVGEAITVDFHQ